MLAFAWNEILLLIFPIALLFIIDYFFKDYLTFFPAWPINYSLLLIPTWLVCIHAWGRILFQFNVLPFAIFLATFMLGLHLYEYVKIIAVFTFQNYYLKASKVFFSALTAFLLGLIFLRFFEYFRMIF